MRLGNLSAQPAPTLTEWFTVSSYLCSHSLVSSSLSLNLTVETWHPRNCTTPLPSQYLLSQGCREPHRRELLLSALLCCLLMYLKLEILIVTRSSHFWSTEYLL